MQQNCFPQTLTHVLNIIKMGKEFGDIEFHENLTKRALEVDCNVPIHSILSFKFLNENDF